jgi:hypothetical protein
VFLISLFFLCSACSPKPENKFLGNWEQIPTEETKNIEKLLGSPYKLSTLAITKNGDEVLLTTQGVEGRESKVGGTVKGNKLAVGWGALTYVEATDTLVSERKEYRRVK